MFVENGHKGETGSVGAASGYNLFQKVKEITFLIRNLEFLQELVVLFLEGFLTMVLLLVNDIAAHLVYMRPAIGKHPITILPMEAFAYPTLVFNKAMALDLDLFHKVGDQHRGIEANKQVGVVGHAMHRQHFGLAGLHQGGYILMQLCFVLAGNEALPALHGKDKLQVDLGKGVGHGWRIKMLLGRPVPKLQRFSANRKRLL